MIRWISLAIFAALALVGPAGAASASVYHLPDAELLASGFDVVPGYSTSSSTLDSKVDVAGPGVQFIMTLAGAENGKIGIGDPWPTDSAAGLAWDPVLHHNTSLATYSRYQMRIRYVAGPADSEVDISLFMNTGLTGPSGYPSNDWTNDTFWGGNWFALRVGQIATFTLDFDMAEAWSISNNKDPHTGGGLAWADGGIYAINLRDRNEVSNIGLQVADFDGDVLGSQITLLLNAVLAPGSTGTEYLNQKNPTWWPIVPGGGEGLLEYSFSGPTFDFVFDGQGLEPLRNFTLIYYPDPWPGIGLIQLGSETSDGDGDLHLEASVDTGDLPTATDDNYPDGAKIWLVLSSDLSADRMVGWHPNSYLFESDLISYQETTGFHGGAPPDSGPGLAQALSDEPWGQMRHDPSGPLFAFTFDGVGLEPEQDYTLIYYPEPYPGEGLIRLGAGSTDVDGCLHIEGPVETNSDLPAPDDENYPDGARIVLVLSSDLTETGMATWQPERYLLSDSLIAFCDMDVGVNYPWYNYGWDFGDGAWGRATDWDQVDADFERLAGHGIRVVRWFVFCDGRYAPEFDDEGYVVGLDPCVLEDFQQLLSLADKWGIYLMPTLLDFLWLDPAEELDGVVMGGHSDIISEPAKRQSFVENALRPLLKVARQSRAIYAWDIINEPEWRMEGSGAASGEPVSDKDTVRFVNAVVRTIRRDCPRQRITLGCANRKWLRYWLGPSGAVSYGFVDLPTDHWAHDYVMACVDAGIVNGYPGDLYRPEVAVKRDQMAVYITRAVTGGMAVPEGPEVPTFTDVALDHWAYDSIEYAAANGIVEGYENDTYRPDLTLTRAEMAVFIARAVGGEDGYDDLYEYTPPKTPTFTDVGPSFWAYKHVEYTAEQGIVRGYTDGRYRPMSLCARDQMAIYIGRAFGLMNRRLDFYQIHAYDWAEGSSDSNFVPYQELELGKPCVVGEFPTAGSNRSVQEWLDLIYGGGYAGALAWSYRAEDSASDWDTAEPVIEQWIEDHGG